MNNADGLQIGIGGTMDIRTARRRIGALCLVIGGIGFFLAGVLHPQAVSARDYDAAISSMINSPMWTSAHMIATVTGIFLATAIWLLIDGDLTTESVWGDAGSRLALVATLFMTVEFSVEAAAKTSSDLLPLVETMKAIGWPAFALGFALVAAGARNAAPLPVRIIGVAGAAAMGFAEILVGELRFLQMGPLFAGGSLLAFWMVWAGIRIGIGGRSDV